VRDRRYDLNQDSAVDERVHTKYMMVSGVFGTNRAGSFVWTGSANWTKPSLRRSDEVTLRIRSKGTHSHYLTNFRDAYRNGSRPTPYSN
jgi:phosphatidylserine/phosphatidylglycerophosphate/cardiolipin synthase-like enzyme